MKFGNFRQIPDEDVPAKQPDYVIDNDALITTLMKTPIGEVQGLQLDDFKNKQCSAIAFSTVDRWVKTIL